MINSGSPAAVLIFSLGGSQVFPAQPRIAFGPGLGGWCGDLPERHSQFTSITFQVHGPGRAPAGAGGPLTYRRFAAYETMVDGPRLSRGRRLRRQHGGRAGALR